MDYNIYIGVGSESPTYQFTDDFNSEVDARLAAEKIAFEEARELAGTRGIKRRDQIEFENSDRFKGLSPKAYLDFVDGAYNNYLIGVIQYQVKPTNEDEIKELVRIDYGTSCQG